MVGQVAHIVEGVGIAIQRLRVVLASSERVGRGKAAQTIDIRAHHRVIVAGFGVALVGGELEFGGGVGGVPVFSKGEMGLLAHDSARGFGVDAWGEMVGDVVVGGGAGGRPGKSGEELGTSVDVFLRGRGGAAPEAYSATTLVPEKM
jgi:hypothetical protein